MPRDEKEIRDLGTYLVTDYFSVSKKEMQTDENYYKDNFKPALLTQPGDALIQYTGEAARQIDLPAEHLITGNPQAFRLPRTKGEQEGAVRVGKGLNHILKRIKRMNPNPIQISLKTNLKRGEVYTQLIRNSEWTSENQVGLPIYVHLPDPLTVFPYGASPEYDCVPDEVIISCKRGVQNIQRMYPDWKYKGTEKSVQWLGYYSKDQIYFEAGNEPVTKGIEPNIMKFTPFVHVYTGYGSDSPDAAPQDLAVGRLRNLRSILDSELILFSDAMRLVHAFVYPFFWFRRESENVPDDAIDNVSAKPFSYTLFQAGVVPVPVQDLLQNLNYILQQLAVVRSRLDRELSPLLEGIGGATSGRDRDMATSDALRRFETVMDNLQTLWGVTLSQMLRAIDTIPDMLPMSVYAEDIIGGKRLLKEASMSKEDIAGYYNCWVELKASEALDADRRKLMYRNDWQSGFMSKKTALIKGEGYTADEADQEMEDRDVEDAMIPLKPIIGLQYAQERGIPVELLSQLAGNQTKGRPQEIQTQRGGEMIDSGFQRGGRMPAGAMQ